MSNPHDVHMTDRVAIAHNAGAGRTDWGSEADDWQPVLGAGAVPCLVTTDREMHDAQADPGRNSAEDVRRYKVAFTAPPVDLGRNHRLTWDAGPPIGVRTLYVVSGLVRDPTGDLWTCGAEDRGTPAS